MAPAAGAAGAPAQGLPPIQTCNSGPGWAEIVFNDRSGCTAACSSLGLMCHRGFENLPTECGSQAAELGCGVSGHESDACICTADGGPIPGTDTAASGGAGGGVGSEGVGGTALVGNAGQAAGAAPGAGGATGTGGAAAGGQGGGGAVTATPEDIIPTDCLIRVTDPALGWATQEGGTTGGGTDLASATRVASQAELDAALGGSGLILVAPGQYVTANVRINSNTSIIGTAPGVVFTGNLRMQGVSNIILRNFELRGNPCTEFEACRAGEDGILIRDDANHVWADHVSVVDGQDGNFDVTQGGDFVTCSWCQFRYSTPTSPTLSRT
jgi:pectate lyase